MLDKTIILHRGLQHVILAFSVENSIREWSKLLSFKSAESLITWICILFFHCFHEKGDPLKSIGFGEVLF